MTSVITSFCPTTFQPGKTQSCLIDAMIYDFQEITLHVTEPLDWSYANPRCWIQFRTVDHHRECSRRNG
ncbi:kinase [Klebsiella pneumoniae]|nr:kinase [Klebsiella pneumoniae]